MHCVTLWAVVVLAAGASALCADTFILKNGDTIYGTREREFTDAEKVKWIEVKTAFGTAGFKESELLKVLPLEAEPGTLYLEEMIVLAVKGTVEKSADEGQTWTAVSLAAPTAGASVEAGKAAPPPPAAPDPRTLIRPGDRVRTAKDSELDLALGYGVLFVGPDSEVEFRVRRAASMRQFRGATAARFESLPKEREFKVETPEGALAVKGTSFAVTVASGETRLAVEEGAVAFGATDVGAGQALAAQGGEQGPVVTLGPEDGAWFARLEKTRERENDRRVPDRELRTLAGHGGSVLSVVFSPDGKILASGGGSLDYTVKIWDPATGRELRTLTGHMGLVNSVAFSPDGRMLASGSRDKTVKIWDPATGRELRTLAGHMGSVNSVAFSPDGKILASGSGDNTVKIWNPATGNRIRTLAGHKNRVFSVAFSPDGKMLASGAADATVKIWDPATGREVRTLAGHTESVYSVAFSPDGKMLASGAADNTVKIWDPATGREIRTLAGHTNMVNSVAFSPDGKMLASGAADDTVKIWDPATGREIRTLAGHAYVVNSVAFSPDGKTLASGSLDETVKIWGAGR